MKVKALLLSSLVLLATQALALRAFFDYKVFNHPADGPYVECITSFDGATFQLGAADSGLFMAKAELMIIISRMGEIVEYKKLNINGPLVASGQPEDFMSLEGFLLPNGIYDVELEIKDLVRGGSAEVFTQKMEINNLSSGIFISDIEFHLYLRH